MLFWGFVMKLLRVGPQYNERPTMLADDGSLRDLTEVIDDVAGPALSQDALATLAKVDWRRLPIVDSDVRIGPCVAGSKNFVCIGANYADAVAQQNNKPPTEPVIFLKSLSAICGPYDDLVLPDGSKKTDWEVELGVIIGKRASYVETAHAMDYVAGYCVCNDVSERELQYEHGPTWDKGKGCDSFGPIGPWFVTRDEVPASHDLDLWLDVNGRRMQSGNTKTMIFGIPEIISYVSRLITLYPGDIISTGTPPGGGIAQKPEPIFLKEGEEVRAGIRGLGEQRQHVVTRASLLEGAGKSRNPTNNVMA